MGKFRSIQFNTEGLYLLNLVWFAQSCCFKKNTGIILWCFFGSHFWYQTWFKRAVGMIQQHSNILFRNNAKRAPKHMPKVTKHFPRYPISCFYEYFLLVNVYHLLLPFKLLDVLVFFVLCQYLTQYGLHYRFFFSLAGQLAAKFNLKFRPFPMRLFGCLDCKLPL